MVLSQCAWNLETPGCCQVSVGAEAILKSECDLFEKSKKMRLYPKNSKANEERQQDNRGHINFYIYATFSVNEIVE